MPRKSLKKSVDNPIDINKAEGKKLLNTEVVAEITDEVLRIDPDNNLSRCYLLKNGTVLSVFIFDDPKMFRLYPSKENLLENVKYFLVRSNEHSNIVEDSPLEDSYSVSKDELDSLLREDRQQLAEHLDLPIAVFDYSMQSVEKISKKTERLNIDYVKKIALLLNVYACRVIVKEGFGKEQIVQTSSSGYTLKVKVNNGFIAPMYVLADQLEESDEGFSYSVVLGWTLGKYNNEIHIRPKSTVQ